MTIYKIVYVKNEYLQFINYYPKILNKLLLNERSMYDSKQLQQFFMETHYYNHYFQQGLFSRSDYSYFHGIHKIKNEITDDEITFQINIYDIEVNENHHLHIIYDYLKGFSQNFYLIEL